MTNSKQSDNNKSKSKFYVPKFLRRERKKRDKFLEAFEEWNNLSLKEQEERRQLADLIERNSLKWYKVSPDTKATIRANVLLSILLIVITSITVIQQCSTNKLQQESIGVMLKQDSTNQRNLALMQKEFNLNYRPYMMIKSSVVTVNNNLVNVDLHVENVGKVPGICQVMYVTRYEDQPKLGTVIKEMAPNVFFPGTGNTMPLRYTLDRVQQMAFFKVYLDYKNIGDTTYTYHTVYDLKINLQEKSLFLGPTLIK